MLHICYIVPDIATQESANGIATSLLAVPGLEEDRAASTAELRLDTSGCFLDERRRGFRLSSASAAGASPESAPGAASETTGATAR